MEEGKITLSMMLTFDNGAKLRGHAHIVNTGKPLRLEDEEKKLVKMFNKSQQHMSTKAVKCKIFRN